MRPGTPAGLTKYSLFCLFLTLLSLDALAASPSPFIDNLSPPSADVGSGPVSLTIHGAGLSPASRVSFNDQLLNPDSVTSTEITVTIPYASLAAPGTATVTVVNDPQMAATRSNPRYFPVSTPTARLLYTRSVSEQTRPVGLATADFNADGNLDLALLDDTGPVVKILKGDGSGGFAPYLEYPLAGRPSSIRAADFNNDRKPDLLVMGGGPITVLLNDGAGAFSRVVSALNGGGHPVTADFNADGKLDFIVDKTVLVGDGLGHFQIGTRLPEIPEHYSYPNTVAGDFNGDGKLDVVAVQGGVIPLADIFVGDGLGNFRVASSIYLEGTWRDVSDARAADFNDDGKLDFVVTSRLGSIVVFIGKGDGTFFRNYIYYGNSSYARSALEVGDFNGDHKVDVILAGRGYAGNLNLVFYGDGSGSFLPVEIDPALQNYAAMAVGDFNQDGRLDAAIAYQSESVGLTGWLSIVMQNAPPPRRTLYTVTDLCWPRICNATILGDSGAAAGPGFVVYPPAAPLDLNQLGYPFVPSAMNRSGVVVGKVSTSPTEAYLGAWLPQRSQMFNLAATPPDSPPPFINDHGDIAGTPLCRGGAPCSIHGVIPSVDVAGVRAIFNNGNVWAFGPAELYSTALGSPVDLGASSYLFNTAGHLLGTGSRAGQFFNFGAGFTPLPIPAGFTPQSFNNTGTVAGFQRESADAASPALFTASQGVVPLNSLVDPQSGWTPSNWQTAAAAPAMRINNGGQILLTATKGGRTTSVLLTPYVETLPGGTQALTSKLDYPASQASPGGRAEVRSLLRQRPFMRNTRAVNCAGVDLIELSLNGASVPETACATAVPELPTRSR